MTKPIKSLRLLLLLLLLFFFFLFFTSTIHQLLFTSTIKSAPLHLKP
jgi:hypothetical protein